MAFTDPRTRKPIADDLVGEALEDLQDQITNFVPAPVNKIAPIADVSSDPDSIADDDAKDAIVELQSTLNDLLQGLRDAAILDE